MKRSTLRPGGGGSLLQNFVLDLKAAVPAADASDLVIKPEISFYDFVRQAWPILEPGHPFKDNWHIGAVVEHMEAVATFEIKEIIFNMPPRHMKSLAISGLFAPWVWTWAPARRFFYTSYELTLARRDNMKARKVIQSAWYQERWGSKVIICSDQNEKSKIENTHTGSRFVSSSGGKATGEGGDYVICDDPHNVKDAGDESDTKRKSVLDWWDNTMSSRLDDPERGAFVVVGQRVHQNDLSGHLLAQGGWEHLCLPAEYEGKKYPKTSLGFEDPRTVEGELLWPERVTKAYLEKQKKKMLPSKYAGQYQQRPAPAGGHLFKRAWFKRYAILPKFELLIDFWDTAQSVKAEAARSCNILMGLAHNGIYLVDLFKERLDYPTLKDTLVGRHEASGSDAVVVEDKSSGISVIQDLQKNTRVPVIAYEVGTRSKVDRAIAQTEYTQGGNIWLPEDGAAPWIEEFLDEIETFPSSLFKDQMDTFTMGLDYLRNNLALTGNRDMS